ncbi:MAG TPA: hypothetical protein VGA13_02685 [Acidimicrobiales bacterium]
MVRFVMSLGARWTRRRAAALTVVAAMLAGACGSSSSETASPDPTVPPAPPVTTSTSIRIVPTDTATLPPHPLGDDPTFDLQAILDELWTLSNEAYNTSNFRLLEATFHEARFREDIAQLRDRAARGEHYLGELSSARDAVLIEAPARDLVIAEATVGGPESALVDSAGNVLESFPESYRRLRIGLQHIGGRWFVVMHQPPEEVSAK